MTFGERLKTIRLEKKLTQKQLADLLNVTFQTVSKWENDVNEPSFSTLRDISKALDCSVGYLFGEETKQSINLEELPDDDYRKIIIYAYLGKYDKEEYSLSFLKDIKEEVTELLALEAKEKGIFKGYRSFTNEYLRKEEYISHVFNTPFIPASPKIEDANNIMNAYVAKKIIDVIVHTEKNEKTSIIENELLLWKSLINNINKREVSIRNLEGVNKNIYLVNENLIVRTYIKTYDLLDHEIRTFSRTN